MTTTLLGARVAGYTIESVAGRGGMGVVYRARDRELDRIVALKLIAPELARDNGFRARFVREARITAQLDHPNVIPVYDAGEDDGQMYLAMRFVDGTDVAQLIREQGRLEPRLAAELVAQAASALDCAHARGLVHRDVKPANLLLPREARTHVYLTDFGLAKRDGSSTGITTTDHWLGTPDYASPEQIEGRELDGRADVYSLGCVLFTALTGRPPFAEVPLMQKGWAQATQPPPRAPGAFGPVIERALAKDPRDRYSTAGDLGDAALAAAAGTGATRSLRPRRHGHTVPTARLSARPRRRRWPVAAAILLGLALAGAATAALLLLGDGSSGNGGQAKAPAHRPLAATPRPAAPAPPPAPDPAKGTVRCDATACTQGGTRVSAPIDGGTCGSDGSWTRIDAGDAPLVACMPGSLPTDLPAATPDLVGARLDHAEDYLDALGVDHDTSGGGTFGVLDSSAWQVCATDPAARSPLPPNGAITLFVDRSC